MARAMGLVLLALALAGPASAGIIRSGRRLVKVEEGRVPSDWKVTPRGAEHDGAMLSLTVALRLENVAALEEAATQISDPDHARFRKFLTAEEANALAPACEGCADRVSEHLRSAGGAVEVSRHGDFVTAQMTVATAEETFGTPLCFYEKGSVKLLRSCEMRYHAHESVAGDIAYVAGLLRLPADGFQPFHTYESRSEVPESFYNDPKKVKGFYNQPDSAKATSKSATMAVGAFLGQWFSPSDLQMFYKEYLPELAGTKPTIIGPNDPSKHVGVEANLDIQYINAMGPGVPSIFWSNDVKNPVNHQEPWTEFLKNVSVATTPPNVISTSYGDNENTLTVTYMDRVTAEYVKIASRGITMITASGDSGAGCNHDTNKFLPTFPATSPWVTSVGATTGDLGAAYFSSGGFSDYFGPPAYQAAACKAYLSNPNLPSTHYFNSTGRCFPDVSAVGTNVPVYVNGFKEPVAGTSCAAPIFAGVVALITDFRVAKGKSGLGFLNPVLYKNPGVLQDATSGTTEGCDGNGWPTTKGWDAATGLGYPNYPKMLALLMKQ